MNRYFSRDGNEYFFEYLEATRLKKQNNCVFLFLLILISMKNRKPSYIYPKKYIYILHLFNNYLSFILFRKDM